MPNRILRDGILTSERVDRLSPPEEVFYRRLMSVVDDQGHFSADPTALRDACYPRRLDTVSPTDVAAWLDATVRAKLVTVTDIDGDRTLRFHKLHQNPATPKTVESIYALYPRKVGKRAALEAIRKALQRIADRGEANPAKWLEDRVEAYAATPASKRGRFTPHAKTWFGQDRFDDDPAEWQRSDDERGPAPQRESLVDAVRRREAERGL